MDAQTETLGWRATFSTKTYSIGEFAAGALRLAPFALRAVAIWGGHRIAPQLREEIMLTVAYANECSFCSYIHQNWAIETGVSDAEIAALEGLDPDAFDRATWTGLVYARALAEADFGAVPDEILDAARLHHDDDRLADIETVARVMAFANRTANTIDALDSRRRGVPAPDGRLADELLIAGGLGLVAPVLVPALALVLRKRPLQMLHELRGASGTV